MASSLLVVAMVAAISMWGVLVPSALAGAILVYRLTRRARGRRGQSSSGVTVAQPGKQPQGSAHPELKVGHQPAIQEARRERRVTIEGDVTIHVQDGAFRALSRKLGGGGMSFVTDARLGISQPMELSFALPPGRKIAIPAVVWWKRGKTVGVRFDVNHGQMPWIRKWVEEQIGRMAPAN